MKRIVGRDSLASSDPGMSITIGTFDGVHLGHRALMAKAIERAGDDRLESCVLTWDRHPAATLRPEKLPPLLTTPARKVELIEEAGIATVVVVEFDEVLSHWSPEEFARRILATGLNAQAVFVGQDWRFGHKAVGDVGLLEKLGADLGFSVEPVKLIEVLGGPASSTRARRAVMEGEMELAAAVLGRPFDMDGVVVRGDDRGASLGWPTANVEIDTAYAHPPRGVYAGRGRVDSVWYPAAINLGVNPTFGGDPAVTPLRIEAYLLDFHGDLYGRTLRVEFIARLRDEKMFESSSELSAQIERDVAATRRLTDAPSYRRTP
ncbi:MAG: bifunctional riboflavin kinase/FAD synthetase [Actinomycetota bacterium]|nr:bifunctional riboflavin kinase/FAD synthetase [Actinomycetota bacterium]